MDNRRIISRGKGNIQSGLGWIRRGKPGRLNLRFLRAGLPIVVRINQRPLGIANLSTRAQVGTGGDVLIGGFVARRAGPVITVSVKAWLTPGESFNSK